MPGADWERQVETTATAYRRMSERIGHIQVTEASRDGTIQVTVSASGLLTDLRLPDPALAEQIMACLRAAQAKIPDQMRAVILETVGSQDPNSHLVLASARERFPAPQKPIEKGDWDERPVLEDIGGGA